MGESSFFSTEDFLPQGHSYLWRADVLWLHVASNIILFIAFTSISVVIFKYLRKSPSSQYKWIFIMFGLFIGFSGLSFAMSVITVWKPLYGVEGILKAITASISMATAVLFIPLAPHAFRWIYGTKKEERRGAEI